MPIDPNTLSRRYGEEKYRKEVRHVTGDEKCEWVIWDESRMWVRMSFGSVYWESLRGSFFGILYLYLWYNHVTSRSND